MRATPGSVGRLARPRTQHTRADQHDDDDAEDDPVPDERHEALGGDELHEPEHQSPPSTAVTCRFHHSIKASGRGLGELVSVSHSVSRTKVSKRSCSESIIRRSIAVVTFAYRPSTPATSCPIRDSTAIRECTQTGSASCR